MKWGVIDSWTGDWTIRVVFEMYFSDRQANG